jgi:hypothetical protein
MKDIQIGDDRIETEDTTRSDWSCIIIVSVRSFKRPYIASNSNNATPYNIQTGCTFVIHGSTKHESRSHTGCRVDRQYSSILLIITWNWDSCVTLISRMYDGWMLCSERPTFGHVIQTGNGVHPVSYITGFRGWSVQNVTLTSDLLWWQSSKWVHQNLYSLHTSSSNTDLWLLLMIKFRVSPPKVLLPPYVF